MPGSIGSVRPVQAEDIPSTQATDAEVAAAVATRTVNPQTDDYTLVLTDAGKLITLSNAGAKSLTVPTNAAVAFVVGTEIVVIQIGAGLYTIVAAGGVTVVSGLPTLKFSGQYGRVVLTKIATNTWVAAGGLALV